MSGISVTSAFARDRIEISEVMRAMETTFISARVLIVGRFGYVGVSRDRIEISEVMRAMETTFISARVLIVGRFGYVGVSRDRIVLWKRRFLYMSFRAFNTFPIYVVSSL